jgi:hypothetical protein
LQEEQQQQELQEERGRKIKGHDSIVRARRGYDESSHGEDMMRGNDRFRKVILERKQGLLVSLRVGLHMHRSSKHQRE